MPWVCGAAGDKTGQYSGMLDCFVKSFRSGGLLTFYNGFLPNFARLGSWNCAMFLTVEQVGDTLALAHVCGTLCAALQHTHLTKCGPDLPAGEEAVHHRLSGLEGTLHSCTEGSYVAVLCGHPPCRSVHCTFYLLPVCTVGKTGMQHCTLQISFVLPNKVPCRAFGELFMACTSAASLLFGI